MGDYPDISIDICSTGQQKEMLNQTLASFDLTPLYELNLMQHNQSLSDLHSTAVTGISQLLSKLEFDGVIVQGDTTTAFAGALAAFHNKMTLVHVEAGLRSHNLSNPFPEEGNRILIDSIATVCAAPTIQAAENLNRAGIAESKIHVTGNTGIDALFHVKAKLESMADRAKPNIGSPDPDTTNRIITITLHRRESFGHDLEQICEAILVLAKSHPEMQFIYPVHLNPNVQTPVRKFLDGVPNIQLTEPKNYHDFVDLLMHSFLILTDSGGIQEEAPSLGIPVLVLRKNTERPEGIEAGCAKLAGVTKGSIIQAVEAIINDEQLYRSMATVKNPYGDGTAASQILKLL
jgi:UDP-N-acetylglucosamine 2-epimerase (non-hydrolysing)